MAEVKASVPEQSINPPPPPPTTQRRPRVREVSSRFMSPVAPSPSNYSPLPRRSSSVQKQRQSEVLSTADENRLTRSPPLGKQHQRAVMKLFKENAGIKQDLIQSRFQRPDTPTVNTSSKLRLMQQRSIPNMSSAAKISSSSPNSSPMQSPSSSSHQSNGELARTCSLPDIRSSMPEVSTLPRPLVDRSVNRPNGGNGDSCKPSASPCSRSLDFQSMPEKAVRSSAKMGGLPLPPAANCARKAKKVASHQEDVHSLRLLHNHYLQWRFANAKAEASTKAQARETEKLLYSLSIRISELYDSLKCRRLMLSILRRAKVLSEVVENQMPHLEEWSSLEEDYSSSLLEAVQALSNVSLRLPLSGNIRVDAREIGEALTSANKLMEMIASHVQKFIPKAEQLEILVSELARAAGGERSLIEECGDLLSKAQKSQVEECSLRTQLIQLNQICQAQLHCTS